MCLIATPLSSFLSTQGMGEKSGSSVPLFETRVARGRRAYKVFVTSMLASICLVWVYRARHMPCSSSSINKYGGEEQHESWWVWVSLFFAELWFGFYWILTQAPRWSPIYHFPFKDRLSQRYKEDELPNVDIFICTADPTIEPPSMVMSTVLSVMAYDYPSAKLSVYLSDDGGSDLTFYALLEASKFAEHWLPFCRKYKIESCSPEAYFSNLQDHSDGRMAPEWFGIKGLFEEMVERIDKAVKLGRVPDEMKKLHKGFQEWTSSVKHNDHHPIVQVVIDGRNGDDDATKKAHDLPTLVYLSREKRPHRHHNFKAGAMNALIRASSHISNGKFILNVDCDMFSNNSATVREALCFFLDGERGQRIGFVQYPQLYHNVTPNDLYGVAFRAIYAMEGPGLDGQGGVMYIGSGCFHRREALGGMRQIAKNDEGLRKVIDLKKREDITLLEDKAKAVATCTFEDNTLWGKELGLKYNCAVEDIMTSLSIHCKGWKSVFFNPKQEAFLGVAPMTLGQTLVQQQRWGEGHLQVFLSKYCSYIYGHGKIKMGHQMGYSVYNLWAANSFPTLLYVTIPPLALLSGMPLYPKVSSLWFLPFAYVIIGKYLYSFGESQLSGETLAAWWNIQRMWLLKRITSYIFAVIDVTSDKLGLSKAKFVITSKVTDDQVLERYKEEVIDFGATPPVFSTIIATTALLNLFCFIGGIKGVVVDKMVNVERLFLQFCLCGSIILLNLPIYNAMLFRRDMGSIPTGIRLISLTIVASGLSLHAFVF